MAGTFRTRTDANGVKISDNSHSAESYSHPLSEQRPAFPHWMAGEDGQSGYMEPPARGIVHKTKDRMLTQLGRPGAMIFDGDLLSRSERMTQKEVGRPDEPHDSSCWCEECRPFQQANMPMAPVKAYRR
jgi:hypothetical protein